MDELLRVFCFVSGTIIVYRCGTHIEMMRVTSNHFIRLAYWSLCVGGLAVAFSAFDHENWLRPFGFIAITLGVSLLCVFDRRLVLDPERERRSIRAPQA